MEKVKDSKNLFCKRIREREIKLAHEYLSKNKDVINEYLSTRIGFSKIPSDAKFCGCYTEGIRNGIISVMIHYEYNGMRYTYAELLSINEIELYKRLIYK